MQITDYILYLMIYSFFGWCCETVYCSVDEGHLVNRGFLNGPFCPVYGFGAIFTLLGLQYMPQSVLGVFLGGMVITSLLEYFTSWGMEKLFHAKWWDYSSHSFHINGRVCLLNSTLFGFLCLFLYFDLHPFISNLIVHFSTDFKLGFLFAFMIYLIIDMVITIRSVLGINSRLEVIGEVKEKLLARYAELDEKLDLSQIEEKLKLLNIKDDLTERMRAKKKELSFFEKRLIKAFPNLSNKKYGDFLKDIRVGIKQKRSDNN